MIVIRDSFDRICSFYCDRNFNVAEVVLLFWFIPDRHITYVGRG